MAKTPIESVVQKWNQRAQQFHAQGVNPALIKQIGDQDIQRVMRGGSGYSDTEARLALTSASGTGQIIPERERGQGLADLPGNLVKDIGDIAKAIPKLPKAIAGIPSDISNSVKALTDPNYAQELGMEENPGIAPGNFPRGLRNAAKLPIAKWIPTLESAANLTSGEGRKELRQHPAAPIADLMTIGIPGSKALAGFKLAKAGKLTTVGKRGFQLAEGVEKTAMGRLAKGQPVRAGLSKIPFADDAINKIETKIATARGFSISEAKIKKSFTPYATELNAIVKDLSLEDQAKLYDSWTTGQIPDTPELQVAYDKLSEIEFEIRDKYQFEEEKLAPVEIKGQEWLYPKEGRGGRLLTTRHKLDFHQDKLSGNARRLDNAVENAEKQQARFQASIAKIEEKRKKILSQTQTPYRRQRVIKLESNIKNIQKKIDALWSAKGITRATKAYETRLKQVNDLTAEFDKRALETAPAQFHPLLQQEMQYRTALKLRDKVDELEIQGAAPEIIQQAFKDFELGKYSTFFTKKEWNDLTKSIERTWQQMVMDGMDPMFVHVVNPSQFGKMGYKPLDHDYTPGQVRERIWQNMTPTRQNVAVSLSHGALEYLRFKGNEQAFQDYLLPRSLTLEDADKALYPQILKESKKRNITLSEARNLLFDKHYKKITDIEAFSFRNPRIRAMMGGQEKYLPMEVYETWRELAYPKTQGPIRRTSERVTAAFKISLFSLSLRHAADEILGGIVMMMGRGDWRELGSIKKSIQMVKAGELPVEIFQQIDIDSPDKLLQLAAGAKGARILEKVYGKVNALQRFTTFVTNIEKGMAFLGGEKRALAEGYDLATAREIGLKHVEKVFVDYHGMLPIERTVIRQIFPFYAFARYALRYVLSYPIDHPYRASILSHFAAAERDDWDSGLPQLWQSLFFLGDPDPSGNIKASNIKVINPFRDIDSMMSLQGFYSQLGPLPKIALLPLGVNTITGTPDMYPELTYDPETGSLTTKRMGVGEMLPQAISSILPPAQAIEHFVQTTQTMRNLKATNPRAYERQLYSALGIPFIPTEYNVAEARAKGEVKRYKAAQGAVSSSLRGSSKALEGYDTVPFNGQFVDAQQLQRVLEGLELPEGLTPRAVARPQKKSKTPAPLPQPKQ